MTLRPTAICTRVAVADAVEGPVGVRLGVRVAGVRHAEGRYPGAEHLPAEEAGAGIPVEVLLDHLLARLRAWGGRGTSRQHARAGPTSVYIGSCYSCAAASLTNLLSQRELPTT